MAAKKMEPQTTDPPAPQIRARLLDEYKQDIENKLKIKPGDPANGLIIVSSLFLVIAVQILSTLDPAADSQRSVLIMRGCQSGDCAVYANAVVANSVLSLSVSIWIICASLLVTLMDYAIKCIMSMVSVADWRWNAHGYVSLLLIQIYIFLGGTALIYNGWLIGQAMLSLVALRVIPTDDTRTVIPNVDVDMFLNNLQNQTLYPTGAGLANYQNIWFRAQIVVIVFVIVSLPFILTPYYVLMGSLGFEVFRLRKASDSKSAEVIAKEGI